MKIDKETKIYFEKKIKQVFVYITNNCQLSCKQCLYKPKLRNGEKDIDFNILEELLKKFFKMGAYKITFLGGEPTLYNDEKNKKNFKDIIESAKKIGYTYIRFDTNGQYEKNFFDENFFQNIDEITFSLDGYNKEICDYVRGKGSFKKCVENIKDAVLKKNLVQINTCVHKKMCENEEEGYKNIKKMINFCENLNVSYINFHPILKIGVSRDNWIDDTDISLELWEKIYNRIYDEIKEKKFSINVRIPKRVIDTKKIKEDYEKFFYCPVKLSERALIMPDGQIKVCAFTIGTDECLARYTKDEIKFEKKNNEIKILDKLNKNTVCARQKSKNEKKSCLCMSYKPNQKEIVWEEIQKQKIDKK